MLNMQVRQGCLQCCSYVQVTLQLVYLKSLYFCRTIADHVDAEAGSGPAAPYQLVSRRCQLIQQGLPGWGFNDIQEAPEVAGVLQPCWLQEVVDCLHCVSTLPHSTIVLVVVKMVLSKTCR